MKKVLWSIILLGLIYCNSTGKEKPNIIYIMADFKSLKFLSLYLI